MFDQGKSNLRRKIVQWAIMGAIFLFLGKMVWENWAQVREASFTFQPFPFIVSTLLFASCYAIQFWAWYLITLKLGIALSLRETLESWFYSQLGKYLPGKIWTILGRFYFYEARGKSREILSVALTLEMLTLLIGAGFVSVVGLPLLGQGTGLDGVDRFVWMAFFSILAGLLCHPRVLQTLLNRGLALLKRSPIFLSISYPQVLKVILICVLVWGVGGLGFYVFVDSILAVPWRQALPLTGALALSSVLGLVAIFAPGGLGVREGVLVYFLSWMMPGAVAVIVSVLTRLWMTLVEIGLIGVIYLVSHFKDRVKKKESHV